MIRRGLEKLRDAWGLYPACWWAQDHYQLSLWQEPMQVGLGIPGQPETSPAKFMRQDSTQSWGLPSLAFLDQAQALGIQVIASPGASAGRFRPIQIRRQGHRL